MTAKINVHGFSEKKISENRTLEEMQKYQAEFCLNTIGPQKHTVFQIDQSSLRPTTEKRAHWSIAWSDLMMTMFILFLSLFVYQAAHKDFLVSNQKEIVAGQTEEVMEVAKNSRSAFPFVVIKPAQPLLTTGSLKKVETIALQEVDLDSTFSSAEMEKTIDELANTIPQVAVNHTVPTKPEENIEDLLTAKPIEQVFQPLPLGLQGDAEESVNTLYEKSQVTLNNLNLNEFATIDLVPDKAVRIILTGDLLFETGDAALSSEAVLSLEKIASVINETPYQVHIEGHTDNIPIHSGKYANNWELSFARANAVAVFLIKDMGMDPQQFVISGYSSYRPIAPNTTAENRAGNRRVEIVIAQMPYQIQDTPIASTF